MLCRLFGVSTWAGFRDSGPAGGWLWSSGRVFRPFVRSLALSLGGLSLKYAFIRVLKGFLEGFMGFVWVYVVLVLCVACGAFVCVSG